MDFRKKLVTLLLALAATAAGAQPSGGSQKLPVGWFVTESAPKRYEASVDGSAPCEGTRSASLRSLTEDANGYGTFMQAFGAQDYRGKRLRFSASVRIKDVEGWAGLWMRVEGPDPKQPLAFDNMQSRALVGTRGCKRYEVVLDVPKEATAILAGIIMSGTGQAWLDGVRFDVVDASVPVTDLLASPPVVASSGPAGLEDAPVTVAKNDQLPLGRVGDVWFNHGRVASDKPYTRRADGVWVSILSEEIYEHGIAVTGTYGQRQLDLKVKAGGPRTVIDGTWGGETVNILISSEKLVMRWGRLTRELARDKSAQVDGSCNRYQEKDGPRVTDQLDVCGAAQTTRPPPAQLVIALLANGFKPALPAQSFPIPGPPARSRQALDTERGSNNGIATQ
ncbi:AraC family transcriptional regulator [Pyxidicoccus fallax]|uniref:AraC family transcriptional regulator n=1 Tax=Pyxidicoccus fallax TaxID=394095 RepID=A0A848LLN0_9BACT|nr:AraC family transcriptional regulator [Pyxidicoccus fallax]NMO18580.1 AraC family transcriptional regulator [Pyxidicoccus fallax]NPC82513.1 AraC family transcriptional regulator [Pyxidicoccus fallax]